MKEGNKMTIAEESLALHYEKKGKIRVESTVPVQTSHDLSLAYTPGVAAPCLEIQKDLTKSYDLTARGNFIFASVYFYSNHIHEC